ncbi:MAG: HAMP domain-containing sensor histidine kinase [Cyclobacteriaceae bacterium]
MEFQDSIQESPLKTRAIAPYYSATIQEAKLEKRRRIFEGNQYHLISPLLQFLEKKEKKKPKNKRLRNRVWQVQWSNSENGTPSTTVQDGEQAAQQMLMHDIRSPIGRINALVQLLQKYDDLPEEGLKIVRLMEQQSQKVLDITSFHAIYQQLEAGTYHPLMEDFDLLQLIQHTHQQVISQPYNNPVEISVNGHRLSPQQKVVFNSDPKILSLLLQNIIQNAVEAAPAGSPIKITINRELRRFINSVKNHNLFSGMILTVHNQGVIPVEVRERFFDKYATHGKSRGTGLGTYISMLIAKACGGTISFTTSQNQGTRIRVHLPGNLYY